MREAVDHVAHGLVFPRLSLRFPPYQHWALAEIHHLQSLNLLRRLLVNPRHLRLQGRRLPIQLAQHGAIVAHVVNGSLGIPQHGSLHVSQLAVQSVFGVHLVGLRIVQVGGLHRALNVLADIQWALAAILVPPFYQRLIVGGLVAYFPVDLRHTVVHPSFLHPQQDVGIEVVVVLQSVGVAADVGAALVAVDSEWRHAHFHPGLHRPHRVVQLLDEQVHVVAPPVADVLESSWIALKVLLVGNLLSGNGVGVEVVVVVESVNVVAPQYVAAYVADEVAVLLQRGVQYVLPVVAEHPSGVSYGHVALRQLVGGLRLCAVGVDPCMQLHSAFVALLRHPLKRVPVGAGCLALPCR